MATKIGANQPCPCESGLKYKRCCGRPDRPPPVAKRTYYVLVGLAAVAVAGIVAASVRISLLPDETPTSLLATSQPASAPPGKVWSQEHGHWHNAPPTTGTTLVPQPPGPPVPGKVWSAEHGHYHDAPFTTGATQVPLPQPSGSPAQAKVWSEEHQHWH